MASNQNLKSNYQGYERYIFADAYNLFLKYRYKVFTNETWTNFVEDAESISKKYRECKLAVDIIMAVLNHIEMIQKNPELYKQLDFSLGDYRSREQFKAE